MCKHMSILGNEFEKQHNGQYPAGAEDHQQHRVLIMWQNPQWFVSDQMLQNVLVFRTSSLDMKSCPGIASLLLNGQKMNTFEMFLKVLKNWELKWFWWMLDTIKWKVITLGLWHCILSSSTVTYIVLWTFRPVNGYPLLPLGSPFSFDDWLLLDLTL